MYAGGIAALSARRYDALHLLLATPVQANQAMSDFVKSRSSFLSSQQSPKPVTRSSCFLAATGTVCREASICFCICTPALIARFSWEGVMSRYLTVSSSFLALTFADLRDPAGEGDVWGPPGRFSWKHGRSESPMALLIAEATEQGNRWPPLANGLFGGNSDRLLKVANSYKQLLDRQGRW